MKAQSGLTTTDRARRIPALEPSRVGKRLAPAAILTLLAAWELVGPSGPTPAAPRGAAIALAAITVGVAVLVRRLRVSFGLYGPARLTLPDPLYTLYLAALVLTGLRAAVLLAVLMPFVENLPELLRFPPRVGPVLRQAAASGLTILAAGGAYFALAATLGPRLGGLRVRLLAALVAIVIILLGIGLERVVESGQARSFHGLAQAFTSQALRFQVLLLSVGPLLPLAEQLDDVEAEFAWILFLVPLSAVYYLALVSVRLHQRSEELQSTIAQLSESRRRQAELTDYAALITRAQEAERRRLARELHDDTAQALIALSRGIDTLAPRTVDSPRFSQDAHFIQELGDLAKRTLESVRRACQDLRPPVLDDLGLQAALESLAQAVTRRGLRSTFRQTGTPTRLFPETELTIYRIAQEALANAQQHANARVAAVELHYGPAAIDLRVYDDGDGFDHDAIAGQHGERGDAQDPHAGLGLLGMRERAGLIGAQLEVTTALGTGTTIALRVPFRASPGDASG